MAVTDGSGRVIGVEGLRVCDASIMPTVPCANLNVPVLDDGGEDGRYCEGGAPGWGRPRDGGVTAGQAVIGSGGLRGGDFGGGAS